MLNNAWQTDDLRAISKALPKLTSSFLSRAIPGGLLVLLTSHALPAKQDFWYLACLPPQVPVRKDVHDVLFHEIYSCATTQKYYCELFDFLEYWTVNHSLNMGSAEDPRCCCGNAFDDDIERCTSHTVCWSGQLMCGWNTPPPATNREHIGYPGASRAVKSHINQKFH